MDFEANKSLKLGVLFVITTLLLTWMLEGFVDVRPVIVGILLVMSIILAIQMFIGYIKIRMNTEQRKLVYYIKEYSLKIIVLLVGVYSLVLINSLIQ